MLKVERNGRVYRIILNRPEKRNALNGDMVDELQFHFDRAFNDENIKLIVLSGNGSAFCAGADLAMLKSLQHASYEDNLSDSGKLGRLFLTIRNGPKIVLAAVHGHAIAGGCGLAGACDISIASQNAKLGYTEVRIGFVPAIVTRLLLDKVGETRAKKLLLSGNLISAKEAEEMGLITEAVPAEDFNKHVETWIETLLFKVSGDAVAKTKYLINKLPDMSMTKAISEAIQVNASARSSIDCQKGIIAFLNKDKIIW
ncbi:MAG: enoyl-CoA hydratase/isomerase family protein [Balneolales bacterium]